MTLASLSWNPEQSDGYFDSQLYGSLITLNKFQNGVPVCPLINHAAAILPNLVMPDLKPAKPNFSFGSCELTSHKI